MDWKSFSYGVLTVFVLLLAIISFGYAHIGKVSAITGNVIGSGDSLNNIPEQCRVPAGQDVNSWKEYLGHHADTKECLKYFN